MKTFEVRNVDGAVCAFEIPNHFLGSGFVARFFRRCPGVVIISVRKLFSRSDEHLRFIFRGTTFSVQEAFGDNSRLLVAPVDWSGVAGDAISELDRTVSMTPWYWL